MISPIAILIGVVFALVSLFLWGACAAWVINDAQKRGDSGCAPVIVVGIGGPFSVLVWLLVRPRTKLVERPVEGYENADDALAAASQLDMLGDWDEAIALYQHAATRWPEHGDYINACINKINDKKAAAGP
jgi:hypothetical protein